MPHHPVRIGVRFTITALALAAAAGCSSGPEYPPVEVQSEVWTSPGGHDGTRQITSHYDLRLTVRDAILQQHLAPFIETAYEEYAQLLPPSNENPEPMVTYVFGDRSEWARFTLDSFPAQAYTYLHIHAGGYVDHASAVAVIHDLGRDRTLSLLGHEGFHQYVSHHIAQPLPPWLNEGLACQWESFTLDGDRPVFEPRRNLLRRTSIREAMGSSGGMIPLERLLGMDAGEAVRETGLTVRSYYAQVWSLLLYLRTGADGQYAENLQKLLADAAAGRLEMSISAYRAATPDAGNMSEGEIAFRQYICEDLAALTADYLAFCRALAF